MRSSIRAKLVLAIGLPLLVTYLIVLRLEYRVGKEEALALTQAHLRDLASWQAAELDGDLMSAQQVARTTAEFLTLNSDLSEERIKELLLRNLERNPQIYGMCAAFEPKAFRPETPWHCPYYCRDGAGAFRFVDIAARVGDYTKLDWYRIPKQQGRGLWSEPYFDAGVGERYMCTYSVPFYRGGEFRGIVTVDSLSDDLLKDIKAVKFGGGNGYCILVSCEGAFISHPDKSLVMKETVSSLARRPGMAQVAEVGREMRIHKSGVCRIPDYHGHEAKWVVFTTVPSTGWGLAAILSEKEILAPVYSRLARSLAIPAAGLIVIAGIVLLASRRITKPIEELTAAADRVAHGDLDACAAGIRGQDEIARLARRFNTMVADLKTNTEAWIREETSRKTVEGELRVAREIQASLLPEPPADCARHGFSLHAMNLPAKFIAGDFYDYFFLDDGRLAVAIGDVSGKGAPAALYMAVVRTMIRDFAFGSESPAAVLARVNERLACENAQSMFVTIFFGCFDPLTGDLVYVNAGHNPPYVVSPSGEPAELGPTGPLAGVFPDAQFTEERRRLAIDDLLVLFTDGVTEAHAGDGVLFGDERLERLVCENRSESAELICRTITSAVTQYGGDDLKDDVTILALRRTVRAEADAAAPDGPETACSVAKSGIPGDAAACPPTVANAAR